MEINQIIASNLLRLRAERNLSISKLADLSGVSKSILSQIENRTTNPTINTIWKISSGLHVSYTELLNNHQEVTEVIQKKNTPMQMSTDGHYRTFSYFQSSQQREFELFQIELDAWKSYTSVGHSTINQEQLAQEYLFINQGELTLSINDSKFCLKKDDAIFFDAKNKHSYENTGSEMLIATSINYYH
jgi:XRE family transcriptional regulator, regulator of sulfur utilization